MIHEVEIKRKEKLGSGQFHNVYNFEKFKDKVIRTRYGDIILTPNGMKRIDTDKLDLEEIKIFQQYPDLFVKVFKVTERYAVLEKLDVSNIEKESLILARGIYRYISNFGDEGFNFRIDPEISDPQDMMVSNVLYIMNHNPKFVKAVREHCDKAIFDRWYRLIEGLIKINKFFDVHNYNIGYDKQMKLKMFDT